jgi:MoxR-like ATPase
MRFRYVAIEGPPAVGKTSLARRLAELLDGETVL